MSSNTPSLQKDKVYQPRASFVLPGKKSAPPKKRKPRKEDRNWKP